MADVALAFDLSDGDFYTTPASLRWIADELEAGHTPHVRVTEFASETFEATFYMGREELLDPDYEEEGDDDD